jgi:hypothetical protein
MYIKNLRKTWKTDEMKLVLGLLFNPDDGDSTFL